MSLKYHKSYNYRDTLIFDLSIFICFVLPGLVVFNYMFYYIMMNVQAVYLKLLSIFLIVLSICYILYIFYGIIRPAFTKLKFNIVEDMIEFYPYKHSKKVTLKINNIKNIKYFTNHPKRKIIVTLDKEIELNSGLLRESDWDEISEYLKKNHVIFD